MPHTYKKSGVDIQAGDKLVEKISPLAKSTFRSGVLTDLGNFNASFHLNMNKYKDPILVSCTDGVGTKLRIAMMAKKHDTIGIDLVAMNVNDLITSGAEPLFFLDYFATGKLDIDLATEVIKGMAKGCKLANCSLVGGETAEMPSFYKDGEYDIAGFAVGILEKEKAIDNSNISLGQKLIGIASSGLHSNGYSLVREILFHQLRLNINDKIDLFGKTLKEELLTPTKIYVKLILDLLRVFPINGIAHITGGGITLNLPRILPQGCSAVIKKKSWPRPEIFNFLQEKGCIPESEMLQIFNCGIGLILVVPQKRAAEVVDAIRSGGEKAFIIGEVVKKNPSHRIKYL